MVSQERLAWCHEYGLHGCHKHGVHDVVSTLHQMHAPFALSSCCHDFESQLQYASMCHPTIFIFCLWNSAEQPADDDIAQMLVQMILSNVGNAAAAGHYSVFPNLAP